MQMQQQGTAASQQWGGGAGMPGAGGAYPLSSFTFSTPGRPGSALGMSGPGGMSDSGAGMGMGGGMGSGGSALIGGGLVSNPAMMAVGGNANMLQPPRGPARRPAKSFSFICFFHLLACLLI